MNPSEMTVAPGSDLVLHIDGGKPLSPEVVISLNAFNDRVEDWCGSAQGSEIPAGAVLYVTGAPDPSSWIRELPLALLNKWERALRRLERLNIATVAVATGECGGVALDGLLATDYRIAAKTLRLIMPVAGNGVWPGMAIYRLANQIGVARTRRSVLFGAPLLAEESLALNLVDEVVADPAAALAGAVDALGSAAGSGLAIRRQLMLDATTTSFEEALGRHLAACDRVLRLSSEEPR